MAWIWLFRFLALLSLVQRAALRHSRRYPELREHPPVENKPAHKYEYNPDPGVHHFLLAGRSAVDHEAGTVLRVHEVDLHGRTLAQIAGKLGVDDYIDRIVRDPRFVGLR